MIHIIFNEAITVEKNMLPNKQQHAPVFTLHSVKDREQVHHGDSAGPEWKKSNQPRQT